MEGLIEKVLLTVQNSVVPSASAAATACAAMIVPAPGRFSTTTGWPVDLAKRSLHSRAITSGEVPAGNGTTRRTGRVG